MTPTETETDIPVLTDILSEDDDIACVTPEQRTPEVKSATAIGTSDWRHLEEVLSARLIAQLSQGIAPLLESALREHLPALIEARLHSALTAALATAVPSAAQSASTDLTAQLVPELGARLQQSLEAEVRRSVAEQVARLEI